MTKIFSTCLCAVALLSTVAAFALESTAESSAVSLQNKIYSVFDNSKKSVVKVFAQKKIAMKDASGSEKTVATLDVGSGFIVGKDGIVMTSAFITHRSEKVWVEYNGVLYQAKNVGFDPLTTLSIVKINGNFKAKDAPVITIDGASELPRIGTFLLGVSYEMGLPPSPRFGMATGRNIEFGGAFLPTVYVRTDIPAPRGSTGGAVFDLNGKFAGMMIASIPEIGGSFVLPAKAAAKIRDDILLCGEPVYSWFGLRAEDSESDGTPKIVVILVAENAPAKKSGFMVGDEILEINSKKVSNNTELRDCTFFVRPGETAVFKIKRGGKIMVIDVLAERMSPDIVHAAESNLASRISKKICGDKKSENPSKNN